MIVLHCSFLRLCSHSVNAGLNTGKVRFKPRTKLIRQFSLNSRKAMSLPSAWRSKLSFKYGNGTMNNRRSGKSAREPSRRL